MFQEGEPVADSGQRLLVNPRFALPFRLGEALEVYPEVGYHGTYYDTRLQSFTDRHLLTGRVDLRSRLRKTVDLPLERGVAQHLIEPRRIVQSVDCKCEFMPCLQPTPRRLQNRDSPCCPRSYRPR